MILEIPQRTLATVAMDVKKQNALWDAWKLLNIMTERVGNNETQK